MPVGEKKKLCTVSPRPNWLPAVGKMSSWPMIGTIVREIRFQSALIETGITGWKLSRCLRPSSSGPILWSKLYWNGTLIREATGLESFLASSCASSAAAGPIATALTSATVRINRALGIRCLL